MNIQALLIDAIENKRCISAVYGGYQRELCPHLLGTKAGVDHCLFFQFGGRSSKGLPPGGEWRCIPLAGLSNVTADDETWHTGSNFSKTDKCVDRIIACIS